LLPLSVDRCSGQECEKAPPAPYWGAGGAFRLSGSESTAQIRRARPGQAFPGNAEGPGSLIAGMPGRAEAVKGPWVVR